MYTKNILLTSSPYISHFLCNRLQHPGRQSYLYMPNRKLTTGATSVSRLHSHVHANTMNVHRTVVRSSTVDVHAHVHGMIQLLHCADSIEHHNAVPY